MVLCCSVLCADAALFKTPCRGGTLCARRDTPVLCESLTYSQGLPEVLEGTPLSATRPNTTVYRPPFDEFEVVHVSMPTTTSNQTPLGLQEHLPASPVRPSRPF